MSLAKTNFAPASVFHTQLHWLFYKSGQSWTFLVASKMLIIITKKSSLPQTRFLLFLNILKFNLWCTFISVAIFFYLPIYHMLIKAIISMKSTHSFYSLQFYFQDNSQFCFHPVDQYSIPSWLSQWLVKVQNLLFKTEMCG